MGREECKVKIRIASVKEVVDNIDFIKNHDINLISIRDAEHSHHYDMIDGAGLKNLFVIQFDDLVGQLPNEYRDKYKQKPPSENDIVNILEWVSKIATQKFSKFDVVVFVGTNNPNDIFIGETPTKEVLIFNKEFQKVFKDIN